MKKLIILLIFWLILLTFFILRQEKRTVNIENILLEYTEEYRQYKKELLVKQKIDSLIAPYGKVNYENKYYIAKRFYEVLGEDYARTALCVVRNESGFRSNAYNPHNDDGSNDGGCWQINSVHRLPDSVRFSCKESTEWALTKVSYERNYSAWTAYYKYCQNI